MATISLHHVKASLEGCRRQQLNEQLMLTRAGINPAVIRQSTGRIHTDQVGRLFGIIQQQLNDEFMGFTQTPCKYGAFPMLCELISHCQTLEELFAKTVSFYNLITNDLVIALDTSRHGVGLSFTLAHPQLDHQHFLAEFLLVLWHRFPSWYIGEAIRLRETHFAHSPPQHHEELKIMFPGSLQFNQSSNRLVFDASYLQKPLLRNSRDVDAFLAQHPVDIMTIPGEDSSLESQIERLITNTSSRKLNFLKTEELAKALNMSSLTLYRRLQKEETSYQRIKDNMRREKAIELLVQQNTSVDQVSEIVGFTEPRSFTRAFRQWTGLSPRQYRALYKPSTKPNG